MNKNEYLKLQMQMLQARVLFWHSMIVSGAYKLRDIQKGVGSDKYGMTIFGDMTDEEKLQDSRQIMQSHINHMQECLDAITVEK
jgi:hypothetical protein